LQRECLQIRKSCLYHDHPTIAKSIKNLGLILYTQKNYKEAENLLNDSLKLFQNSPQQDFEQIASTKLIIANIFREQ
jgi:hypothetical protein